MIAKSLRYLGLALSLSLLSACDNLSGPEHELTDDEAAFLAQEFAGEALEGVSGAMAGSPGLAGASTPAPATDGHDRGPVTWERSFTETRPCRAGGTRTTSGTNQGSLDSAGTGTVEITHTLVLVDCARIRDTVTITVNTDPALTLAGTVTIENGEKTGGTFTKTGAFQWVTSDGRSGRCEIDLTITWGGGDDHWDREDHTVTGTICGRDVGSLGGMDRKP